MDTMPTMGKAVSWGMNVHITPVLSRYSLGPKQLIIEPRFTQGEYMLITPYTWFSASDTMLTTS